jgi:hypothetical protein
MQKKKTLLVISVPHNESMKNFHVFRGISALLKAYVLD